MDAVKQQVVKVAGCGLGALYRNKKEPGPHHAASLNGARASTANFKLEHRPVQISASQTSCEGLESGPWESVTSLGISWPTASAKGAMCSSFLGPSGPAGKVAWSKSRSVALGILTIQAASLKGLWAGRGDR